MIVVNMWFIKHTNGLFHYGLDYAQAMGGDVREIWVRNAPLADAIRLRLPGAKVRILSGTGLIAQVFRFARSADLLFTPSSHPIAWIGRQIVVLHDSYPFRGRAGKLKRLLFLAVLKLSCATAAYVNRADGYRWLRQAGLPDAKTRFLPNKIWRLSTEREAAPLKVSNELVVGLFGSDSPKKNYDELFTAVRAASFSVRVRWRIYGHANAYTDRLQSAFAGCEIKVVPSDDVTMEEFIASIDLAASVARDEGFARPVALSLAQGVPTFLLDTAVFREFYEGSARLFPTASALVEAIAEMYESESIDRPTLGSEKALIAGFDHGIAWLKAR
jgi:hypothetical protein